MAKFKPGIPDGFTLEVEPVRDLGDYLDEPSPVPQRRPKAQAVEGGEGRMSLRSAEPTPAPQPEARTVLSSPPPDVTVQAWAIKRPANATLLPQVARSTPVADPQPIVLREEQVIPQTPPATPTRELAVMEYRPPKPKAPRREISMTSETLRMSDELLDLIRSGSGQRDTKANELFHALVLLVHEAMDELDPHGIRKRGRWGTPTARAYPLELKNAFLKALLKKYTEDAGAWPGRRTR